MKKKSSLGARMRSALDLSPMILPRGTLVEIHGQELVKIQGAGRILLYTDKEIKISLRRDVSKGGFVRVRGDGLSCSSYNFGAVGISGVISSVDFGDAEDDNDR